jgi:hypothetical protein
MTNSKFENPDRLLELGFLYPKYDYKARFMKIGIGTIYGFDGLKESESSGSAFIGDRSVVVRLSWSLSKHPIVDVNTANLFSIFIPGKRMFNDYYYSEQISGIWVAPAIDVRLAIIDAVGNMFDGICDSWDVAYESRTHVVFKGISGSRFDNP